MDKSKTNTLQKKFKTRCGEEASSRHRVERIKTTVREEEVLAQSRALYLEKSNQQHYGGEEGEQARQQGGGEVRAQHYAQLQLREQEGEEEEEE